MKYKSLLNSDNYYRARLADAFRTMRDCGPEDNDLSPVSEMDVFITGTSIEGDIYTVLDDAGHAVDVKDFRSVFKLKHRAGRPNGEAFKPEPGQEVLYQALAKLARITSCFPGRISSRQSHDRGRRARERRARHLARTSLE